MSKGSTFRTFLPRHFRSFLKMPFDRTECYQILSCLFCLFRCVLTNMKSKGAFFIRGVWEFFLYDIFFWETEYLILKEQSIFRTMVPCWGFQISYYLKLNLLYFILQIFYLYLFEFSYNKYVFGVLFSCIYIHGNSQERVLFGH